MFTYRWYFCFDDLRPEEPQGVCQVLWGGKMLSRCSALDALSAIGSPSAPPALPSPALTQKNVLRAAEPGEFVSQPAPDGIRKSALLDNFPLGLVIDFLPSYPQLCPALPVSAGLFILMLGLLIA